jgi:hypothetical protein
MNVRSKGAVGFVVGAVAATTLTATTLALAQSGSTTLHACAARRGGDLRLSRTCKASERAVSWNKVGPRGPRGLTGASGIGPAYRQAQTAALEVSAGPTIVALVTLPPGDYLITAAASATTTQPADSGSCWLVGGSTDDNSQSAFSVTANHSESVSFNGLAHTTDVDSQVKLVCFGGTAVTVAEGQIAAVQVTSITDQTPTP